MPELTTYAVFIAGLLSFLSPCILPIVPFYLSYLAGSTIDDITNGHGNRRKIVAASVVFSAGILSVFVLLGASATMLGQAFLSSFEALRWLAVAFVTLAGLHFLGVFRISMLYRQWSFSTPATPLGYIGAYCLGLAFAFGWTPCVGPVLATVLFLAGGQDTAMEGAWLLVIYGFGMTLPFVVLAVFASQATSWLSRLRPTLVWIERAMGVMLLIFSALIATNGTAVLANWMLETFAVFQGVG